MNVRKMAWRNVWRNRRRTLVTLGAMTLALWVMILYSGLMEGYITGMERNILDLEVGDVQVFAAGYRDDPSLYARIDDPDALLERLDQAGYRGSARLRGAGLVAAGDNSSGASFIGVDIERDAQVSQIYKHVADGSWVDPNEPTQVVVGKRLARTLGVGLGDEVIVLSQGADGSMANELYTVGGVLKSIGDVVDRSGVFMTSDTFRELLVVPDGAHQIIVRKPEGVELPAATAEIEELAAGHEVKSWRDLMPTMASMLDSSRGFVYIFFLIIYIAIGIVILNAMLMSVFERIREFGVFKALGVGPMGVLRLVLTESAILTGIALVVATTLSIPGMWYLHEVGIDFSEIGTMTIGGIAWDPVWRAVVNVPTYLGPIITFVVVVALAIVYPALKAAFIQPVAAMRHQ